MPALLAPSVPPVENATRRQFLAALAAGGLLAAGCGTGDADPPPDSGTRTIRHTGGVSEVPARAERVVSLGEALTGHLASVGLLPIAAPDDMAQWLEPYRALLPAPEGLEAIPSIGTAEEPNLELLARLRPDLIVLERDAIDFYPELSAIAPAVVIDRPSNAEWKQAFEQTVDAAGRGAEAQVVRARYRDALAAVPAGAAGTTVTFLRGRGAGTFRIDGSGAFGGSVAREAGFGVDEGGAGGEPSDFGYVEFSAERLAVADGELLAVPTRPGGPSTTTDLEAGPLWATLPAVQADAVLRLPNSVYNGGTYVAAELLVRALADATG